MLTSLIVASSVLAIRHLGGLEKLELAAYDHFISLRPEESIDPRLLIVGVTENDIQKLNQWPLNDQAVDQLLDKLEQYSPRVISLDIMRDVPLEPGRDSLLKRLTASENIITVCKASSQDSLGVPPPPGVTSNFVGFADLVIDSGGVLRRVLFWMDPPTPAGGLANQPGHLCSGPDSIFSLSLQTAFYYLAGEDIHPELTNQGDLRLGNTTLPQLTSKFSGYQTTDTAGYQIMLNYRSARQAAQLVTLEDVLSDRVDPDWIRDRIVFIGYLTPQAGDDFYTPYSQALSDAQKMPGVEIHAQSTSQILSAVLDNRSLIWVWPTPFEALWVIAWAGIGSILAWYIRHPWRLSLAVLGVAVGLYVFCFLLMLRGGWIPLVPPVIALGVAASTTITILNQKLKTENLRIKTELDITRRLQKMILPPEHELQVIEDLDIAGYMDPCDDVGGDYYDVVSGHNGHLKIGIGDVTGHGLESGLIMIMVQTAVRTLLESDTTKPEEFLSALNRSIYHNVQRINSDKTMTLSLLDYKQGTLYLSGQHEDVLIVRANGSLEQIDTVNLGFPIALEEDIDDFLAHTQIHLETDDVVVLYTDGITESRNMEREMYGLNRLCDVIMNTYQRTAQEIRAAVIQDVANHIGQQKILDDITLLVLKQR
ncbi:CHASE2 domain-containing protein [Leptothoe spongobia]|uniref:CHASE2 domain-containing protein n=1 Tax=Leptothoe spongobia TAU-MAC 1115 TaxID=1967444 RepID=A0A947GNA1_9CYAN|nr:CHASE2 domain-containing protein [Leptothoe spongobia]MBT9315941.1 CHASE2 domain-containing protein [Leptothoe spongobia TAU-MAC 1115]